MKIAKLQVKNFLGIKEIELRPGKVNMIKGKNGKGKTSILEAIEKALSNNERRTRVIREGAEKAELLIELDNGLEISRNITQNGNYLTVKKDGFSQRAPQTLLNNLIGQFSFNPIDFINAKPKEQAETLLNLLDIKIIEEEVKEWVDGEPLPFIDWNQHGLKVIDELYKAFYEKRRDVNFEVKTLSSQYTTERQKIPEGFDPEQYRGISLRDKYNELREAQEHNRRLEKSKQIIQDIDREIKNKKLQIKHTEEEANAEIAHLKQKIKEIEQDRDKNIAILKEDITELENRKAKGQQYLAENEPIDTTELEKEVEEFEEKKELVAAYDRAESLKEELERLQTQAEKLDNIVTVLRGKPQELVEKANLPIDGLKVEDDKVMINGRPISDLSEGEKVKMALEIARATAGELKFICVDGIEVLDPENRKLFMKEIENDNMQYFITQATADDELVLEATVGDRKIDPETGEIIKGVS